jgi:hypothetical protein
MTFTESIFTNPALVNGVRWGSRVLNVTQLIEEIRKFRVEINSPALER